MKKNTETEVEFEDDFSISFDELIARIKNKYGNKFDSSEKQAFNHWIRLLNDTWNEFYEEFVKVHGE